MSASFIAGNLFAHSGLDGLAHCCNCAGAMGKGIAVELKDAETFNPGDVFERKAGELTIFNLGTEKHWCTGAELSAIEASVAATAKSARVRQQTSAELVVFEEFKP